MLLIYCRNAAACIVPAGIVQQPYYFNCFAAACIVPTGIVQPDYLLAMRHQAYVWQRKVVENDRI